MKLILITTFIVLFVGVSYISGVRNHKKTRFSQVGRTKNRNMCLLVHSTEDNECLGWDVHNWDMVGNEIADYVRVAFSDTIGSPDTVDVDKD